MSDKDGVAVRIISGHVQIGAGEGFANRDGIFGKDRGGIAWYDVFDMQILETKSGNAAAGALTAGTLGLLGGPPTAAAMALGGAIISSISGSTDMWMLQIRDGANIFLESGRFERKTMLKHWKSGKKRKTEIRPQQQLLLQSGEEVPLVSSNSLNNRSLSNRLRYIDPRKLFKKRDTAGEQ